MILSDESLTVMIKTYAAFIATPVLPSPQKRGRGLQEENDHSDLADGFDVVYTAESRKTINQ